MSNRPVLIITSRNEAIAYALESYVKLFIGDQLPHRLHKPDPAEPFALSCKEEFYETLDNLSNEEIFNAVVIYDLTSLDSPSFDIYASNSLPAEMVLRYPEVYWIFIVNKADSITIPEAAKYMHLVDINEMVKLPERLKRHADGFRPCFDPTGLRWEAGKYKIEQLDGGKDENKSAPNIGAAIDEETNFALFNGYLLYRYGYATYIISSFAEMKKVLGYEKEGSKQYEENDGIDTITAMEDIELRFHDSTGYDNNEDIDDKKSDTTYCILYKKTSLKSGKNCDCCDADILRYRKERFKRLPTEGKDRIIVSTSKRNTKGTYLWLQKPYGGMFDKYLRKKHPDWLRNTVLSKEDNVNSGNKSHAAAGKNQQIAEALIHRSRNIAKEAKSIEEAVHAAVLAEEAKRLLGGRTLAMSLEALKLKHSMEVTAECSFVGASSDLDVGKRFDEIEAEIDKLTKDTRQKNSALVEISDDLRQTYRDYEQFDEEEAALKKVRHFRWFLKYRNWKPLGWLVGIPEAYLNFLISSFICISGMIFIWIAIFGWIFDRWDLILEHSEYDLKPYINSASTFLALQPIAQPNQKEIFWWVTVFEMVFGFTHLGIFIAYLYQKIARK